MRPGDPDPRWYEEPVLLSYRKSTSLERAANIFSRHEAMGCCDSKTLEHVYQSLFPNPYAVPSPRPSLLTRLWHRIWSRG